MTENKSNLEDSPIFAILFTTYICCVLYVVFKICEMIVLRRNLRHGQRGRRWKTVFAAFPALFPFLLAVRTATHKTNNMCAELVPLSYLLRFFIHQAVFVLQMQAVFPLFMRRLAMKWRNHETTFYLSVFFILSIPSIIFVILLWVFQLGIPLNGVCTLGRADGSDQILWGQSVWVVATEMYELIFVVVNIIVELRLKSTIIHFSALSELKRMTRGSLFLILYDMVFRFLVIHRLIILACGSNKNLAKLLLSIYGQLFAAVYVNGMGSLLACSCEYKNIVYFKFRVWQIRFWRLLFGKEKLTQKEKDGYEAYRFELSLKSGKKPAHNVHIQEIELEEKGQV